MPLQDLPSPLRVLQDEKQFNAVKLGPGNTFTIQQTPPDFQLEAFDFGSDGAWTFMSWASGRLEVRDNNTGKRIAQFKPAQGPVFQAGYNAATKSLLVTSGNGLIRFVDPHSGKKLREIHTEVGKFKYDLQKVIVAKDGAWLAYVNEENGRVLDLKSENPRVLADLGDAYDLSLTPDGTELWLVDREKIFGFRTDTWTTVGSAQLLDSVQPTGTPTLALVSSGADVIAFVPSKSGLQRFDLNSMTARKLTVNPAYWVGSDTANNKVLVTEKEAFSLYNAEGSLACQWKQFQHQSIRVSDDGKWLGDLLFGKVQLWDLNSLVNSCTGPRQ